MSSGPSESLGAFLDRKDGNDSPDTSIDQNNLNNDGSNDAASSNTGLETSNVSSARNQPGPRASVLRHLENASNLITPSLFTRRPFPVPRAGSEDLFVASTRSIRDPDAFNLDNMDNSSFSSTYSISANIRRPASPPIHLTVQGSNLTSHLRGNTDDTSRFTVDWTRRSALNETRRKHRRLDEPETTRERFSDIQRDLDDIQIQREDEGELNLEFDPYEAERSVDRTRSERSEDLKVPGNITAAPDDVDVPSDLEKPTHAPYSIASSMPVPSAINSNSEPSENTHTQTKMHTPSDETDINSESDYGAYKRPKPREPLDIEEPIIMQLPLDEIPAINYTPDSIDIFPEYTRQELEHSESESESESDAGSVLDMIESDSDADSEEITGKEVEYEPDLDEIDPLYGTSGSSDSNDERADALDASESDYNDSDVDETVTVSKSRQDRPKRHRIPTLAFYNGERIEYEVTGKQKLLTAVDVRTVEIPVKRYRKRRPYLRRNPLIPMDSNDVQQKVVNIPVFDADKHEWERKTVARSISMFSFKPFRDSEGNKVPLITKYIMLGHADRSPVRIYLLKIEPGGLLTYEAEQHKACAILVWYGSCTVNLNSHQFELLKGMTCLVPKGNDLYIHNTNKTPETEHDAQTETKSTNSGDIILFVFEVDAMANPALADALTQDTRSVISGAAPFELVNAGEFTIDDTNPEDDTVLRGLNELEMANNPDDSNDFNLQQPVDLNQASVHEVEEESDEERTPPKPVMQSSFPSYHEEDDDDNGPTENNERFVEQFDDQFDAEQEPINTNLNFGSEKAYSVSSFGAGFSKALRSDSSESEQIAKDSNKNLYNNRPSATSPIRKAASNSNSSGFSGSLNAYLNRNETQTDLSRTGLNTQFAHNQTEFIERAVNRIETNIEPNVEASRGISREDKKKTETETSREAMGSGVSSEGLAEYLDKHDSTVNLRKESLFTSLDSIRKRYESLRKQQTASNSGSSSSGNNNN